MKLTVQTVFRPLADKVLVRLTQADEKSPGGILLPDTARQKSSTGTVMAKGYGVDAHHEDGDDFVDTMPLGATVYFQPYAGYKIDLPGHEGEFLVMKQEDILGVLE